MNPVAKTGALSKLGPTIRDNGKTFVRDVKLMLVLIIYSKNCVILTRWICQKQGKQNIECATTKEIIISI